MSQPFLFKKKKMNGKQSEVSLCNEKLKMLSFNNTTDTFYNMIHQL